jgi:CHRD domain-containing protein
MRRMRLRFVMLACTLLGSALSAQGDLRYKARLATVPVDFVTLPNVTGSGSATAVLAGSKLSVTGTFEGLGGPATIAQIHSGPLGIRGPVVLDLTVTKATAGSISGSFALKPTQIEELKRNRFYIQIHSEKAPDGNLWGWLTLEERSQ